MSKIKIMGTFFIAVLALYLYFLPTIAGYKQRNAYSIFLLNLFLGWTLIGWVVAIVWAYSEDKKVDVIINNKKSSSEQLLQLKELHQDGTITKEEFEKEKRKILQ